MKRLVIVGLWSVVGISCTSSRVVPAESSAINYLTKSADSSATPSDQVTIFLLERDIPSIIQRLGVVLISAPTKSVYVDRVVKRELQKRCNELGANGAYRLVEGYYPDNTLSIPYLVFKYGR